MHLFHDALVSFAESWVIKMKKKIGIILLVVCIGILLIETFQQEREQNIETFNINVQTESEMKNEVIIATFIQDIREIVQKYYEKKILRDVVVYNYETTVLEVKKLDDGLIQIKFGVTPQIGAHNPVGYDEVTYTINSTGNKKIVDYQHMKSNLINE